MKDTDQDRIPDVDDGGPSDLDPAVETLLNTLEKEEAGSDDSNETPPSDIVAYNELRSCADLFRMHEAGDLEIKPDFQRDVVWPSAHQTRFIDSLVKQLPIPSMCLAYDYKKNKWIVIDGLQRISAIIRFLTGGDWTLSRLEDIDVALQGKTAASFRTGTGDQKTIYNRIQNQTLPVNVLRCNLESKSHNEYLFTIFHRLNSGGIKLNNQEIRNCIYSGDFNKLLRKLDLNAHWRAVNRMAPDQNYRFLKQETILRFFAFLERRDKYKGHVSKFLNTYMYDHRNISSIVAAQKEDTFTRAIAVIHEKIAPARVPSTVLEAMMIGVATNLDACEARTPEDMEARYRLLIGHEAMSAASLAEGLSKKPKVDERLNAAIAIFT